jgi:hypothetical protein
MKVWTTPASTFGRRPLKGATPAAWQSQFRGVCSVTPLPFTEVSAC